MSYFFFTETKNRRAENVFSEGLVPEEVPTSGGGRMWGEGVGE
jgi:hypothetical protein